MSLDSQKHRSINVRRIGYVASEITKNGGIAICAPIAPYLIDRQANRELISKFGGYIEVGITTSLEKCEERDSKGLYKSNQIDEEYVFLIEDFKKAKKICDNFFDGNDALKNWIIYRTL